MELTYIGCVERTGVLGGGGAVVAHGSSGPTSTDIDDLKVFFFTQSLLEGLKAELPLYLLKADGVSTEMIKLQWWQSHEEELPR